MPSKRIHRPGMPRVARAGLSAPFLAGKSGPPGMRDSAVMLRAGHCDHHRQPVVGWLNSPRAGFRNATHDN